MTYPADIRKQALDRRLAGATLREVAAELNVSLATVRSWTDLTPEQRSDAARIRQERLFTANQDLAIDAVERLATRLPHLKDRELVRTYGVSSQVNLNAIRLMQDERRHSNELLEQLRQQLRQRTPSELKAISLRHDHEPPPLPENLSLLE